LRLKPAFARPVRVPARSVTAYLLACIPVVVWIYLLFARGGFWRVAPHLAALPPDPALSRKVVAVVPARDEAEVIGAAVTSLLRQSFQGSIHIVVVDDESTDGTARSATEAAAGVGAAANLTVIRGTPVPPGWTGKLWAMAQGVEAARALGPDYVLFTDADIQHDRDNIASLVTNAEVYDRALVSYMVRLSAVTLAERCLIPAFVFFFLKLYPPAWVASARSALAAAAGGCILIRPQALSRMGGLAAIRSEIIDDCALARGVKRTGGRIWLGLTRSTQSNRIYGSFSQIAGMISRTAFNQLRHSYALLVVTVLGLFLTYVFPLLLLFAHDAILVACGILAWGLMSFCYGPMVRFYGVSSLWSLCLPAIALFYGGATVHSAVQYGLGRGGKWKGRVQDSRVGNSDSRD
jgi:hopene-associated glycosyltransferase HpnB